MQENLRVKLLNREPLDRLVTGESISDLLREIKKRSRSDNPYLLPMQETRQKLTEVIACWESVKNSFKDLWRLEYKNVIASKSSLEALHKCLRSITFTNHKSTDWESIGRNLIACPSLVRIGLSNCDSGDKLCSALSRSSSLRMVSMGTL